MDAQDRVQRFAREADCSTAGQALEGSDETRTKFAEPRGWALKWDGFALSEAEERQNERARFPTVESC